MTLLNLDRACRSDILNCELAQLGISFETSSYAHCLDKLNSELSSRGLLVRPKVWASDEWFCPDGISGIAIPFTLFHQKLIELEKQYLGVVEGESLDWFMKLMRHECGHVMDNAYFLKDCPDRKSTFGDHDMKYPSNYLPRKFSRNFVYHLEDNYAQAHPEEDFAETFATWLTPRSNWRKIYKDWPALNKLKYIQRKMNSIKGEKPNVICYKEVDPISESDLTVKEYLTLKRKKFKKANLKKRSLKHIENFLEVNPTTGVALKDILRQDRRELVRDIALKTNEYQYKIESVVRDLESLSTERKLFVSNKCSPSNLRKILLSHTNRYFQEGRDRIVM